MILKRFTVGPLQTFAYIIGCPETKEAFLVDPANGAKFFKKQLEKEGLILKYIVATHGHPDHTSGTKAIKKIYPDAKFVMHPADDKFFRTKEAVQMFINWGFEPSPPADVHINDGDILEIGNLKFKCIHTPGHSPGSICLYGHGHVITGDTLFVGAAGRTDLPGGSFSHLIDSICNKLATLPDDTIVLPGHDYGDKPTSTIGEEKKSNIYMVEYCI